MSFSFGSLCSGIEGAAVAFADLPWRRAYCAEVEPFCCDLLKTRYPNTPNFGDITIAQGFPYVDLLVAGTPCQSFSAAGKRKGFDDIRGQLALRFVEILDATRPRWVLWENVPGVLSSGGGKDFGTFLGALAEVGYGLAWRVLDARFFGVAQRRRRVFVVGYFGNPRPASEVLFGESPRRGDVAAPRKVQPGQDVVGQDAAGVVGFRDRAKPSGEPDAVSTLTAGRELVGVLGISSSSKSVHYVEESPTLCASGGTSGRYRGVIGFSGDATPKHDAEISPTLRAQQGGEGVGVISPTLFRRLTVTEWERLQGFPDGYTAIAGASDSKRRRALGNSFAVPVVKWVGERIADVNNQIKGSE